MDDREILFVGTADAEHVEMYLKAIWHLNERNEDVKISTIARMLHVRQPSVVQMLKKLDSQKLVSYTKAGVRLTEEGNEVGSRMMRNSRLLEVLMDSALKIEIDEEMVCGVEHHMNPQFTNALCTMLGHPGLCPHGLGIPPGDCCLAERARRQAAAASDGGGGDMGDDAAAASDGGGGDMGDDAAAASDGGGGDMGDDAAAASDGGGGAGWERRRA